MTPVEGRIDHEAEAQARIERWEYEAKREPLAVAVAMVLLENERDALLTEHSAREELVQLATDWAALKDEDLSIQVAVRSCGQALLVALNAKRAALPATESAHEHRWDAWKGGASGPLHHECLECGATESAQPEEERHG